MSDQTEVMVTSAVSAVTMLQGQVKFDVVFMDPTYGKGLEKEVLRHPAFMTILQENALVIVESDLDTQLIPEEMPGLHILKEKIYKTNKHIFLEKDSIEK